MPTPRVAVGSMETIEVLEELAKKGQVVHASYSCGQGSRLGAACVGTFMFGWLMLVEDLC